MVKPPFAGGLRHPLPWRYHHLHYATDTGFDPPGWTGKDARTPAPYCPRHHPLLLTWPCHPVDLPVNCPPAHGKPPHQRLTFYLPLHLPINTITFTRPSTQTLHAHSHSNKYPHTFKTPTRTILRPYCGPPPTEGRTFTPQIHRSAANGTAHFNTTPTSPDIPPDTARHN
jgi:hypothetical protein